MCALFGYLDYGKRVPWKILQKLVQALADASEVRGHHASGIAYNREDALTIFKRPKPAHKLHFRIPQGTTAVMGHTRLTTQGDQKFNFNNHPFRGHAGIDFALAHNGVLYNDDQLRKQLNLPETQIETDSYIAVQLIESKKELTFDSLRYVAEQVRGSFTFTVLDSSNPLYIIKGDNPLHLIHFPTLGLYVYTSTREIMNAAFRQMPVRFPQYEVIAVNEGELFRISADGEITREHFTMHDDYIMYNSRWYGLGSGLFDWTKQLPTSCSDDDDYMILIELSGYYGVDPEDMENGGLGLSYYATHGFDHRDYHDVEDVVFYMWGEDDPSYWSGVESYKELSAEDLINHTIKNTTEKVLNDAYGEWLTDDYPADTIDTEEEKEMLGYKVKRYSGNISFRGEEKKVHYILNYAFVDNEQVLWWMSFTRSDAQSELDEMQYLADLPLNKAKFHE